MVRTLRAAFALLVMIGAIAAAQTRTPQAAVDGLLATDRAFAAAASTAPDPVSALATMFDEELVMPIGGRGYVCGRGAVLAALRESPNFRDGTIHWSPIRAGISADGAHGFTMGYLTMHGAEPSGRDRKYLAYWVRRPEGWRVVTYRQFLRPPGEVPATMLPPSLPAPGALPFGDAAEHARSLAAAERDFSDLAQRVGLREAFRRNGRPDATNAGDQPAFRIGLAEVVAGFPEGETTAPVHWGTDRAIVAASGDLGVSIGTIRPHVVEEGQLAEIPFFTVWRRDGPDQPWRYIAE